MKVASRGMPLGRPVNVAKYKRRFLGGILGLFPEDNLQVSCLD
jgi:hypothetical protein